METLQELQDKVKGWSVSESTMRPEDLIPEFWSLLYRFAMADVNVSILDTLGEIQESMKESAYYESDDSTFDLDYLFDTLNQYAPDGYYFRSHPGNGSDYGFWECEEDN